MNKIICKKDFYISTAKGDKKYLIFEKEKAYDHYSNFGGLNHFAIYYGTIKDLDIKNIRHQPFSVGGMLDDNRPRLYEYFYRKEEARDFLIDKIIE